MCFKNEPLCNPDYCEFARDHYTKVAQNGLIEKLAKKKSLNEKTFKKMAEENTKSDDNESLDDDKVNHKDISDGFDRHDIEMEKQAKLLDRLRYEALMFRDK
jgi:archaellum component FlaC